MLNKILGWFGYQLVKTQSINQQTEAVLTEDNHLNLYMPAKVVVSKKLHDLIKYHKEMTWYDSDFETLSHFCDDCKDDRDVLECEQEIKQIITDCGDCLIDWSK